MTQMESNDKRLMLDSVSANIGFTLVALVFLFGVIYVVSDSPEEIAAELEIERLEHAREMKRLELSKIDKLHSKCISIKMSEEEIAKLIEERTLAKD